MAGSTPPQDLQGLLVFQTESLTSWVNAQTQIYNDFTENKRRRDSVVAWRCALDVWQRQYQDMKAVSPPDSLEEAWNEHMERLERVVRQVYVPFEATGVPLLTLDVRDQALALNVLQASTLKLQRKIENYLDYCDYT